jgi:thiol-disulfide isomerase/thioredoxin
MSMLFLASLNACGSSASTTTNPADTGLVQYSRNVSVLKALDRYSSANYATNFLWWDSSGRVAEFRESTGNVRALLFWNTKCAPCVQAAQTLQALSLEFVDSPFVALGVTTREEITGREAVPVIQQFVDSLGIQYQQILGQRELSYAYEGIESLPTIFFVSREGLNLKRLSLKLDEATLRAEIHSALRFLPPR